jgi:hypothetical protein
LEPAALKAILDDRDVNVSARANHSQKHDATSFRITWTIIIQSQGSIKLRPDECDVGALDKVVEIRPPFQFAPEADYNATNPRHRKADAALLDLCDRGGLNGEMLFHMSVWYETLDRDVCKFRTVWPTPPKSLGYREEANKDAGTGGEALKQWMQMHLEYCTEKEASPTKDIHQAIKDKFHKVEPSMRTQVGIGPRVHQYRAGPKAGHHDFYKVLIPGDGTVQRPVRLKPS